MVVAGIGDSVEVGKTAPQRAAVERGCGEWGYPIRFGTMEEMKTTRTCSCILRKSEHLECVCCYELVVGPPLSAIDLKEVEQRLAKDLERRRGSLEVRTSSFIDSADQQSSINPTTNPNFGFRMESSSSVITPEDVLESLMNDGTIDTLRLKIINQLKANEGLKSTTIKMVEQSKVLNTPGAEKQTKRELFDALRQELETPVLEKASKSVWELILDGNGLGKEINETVEKVFCRLSGREPPLFAPNGELQSEKGKEKMAGKGKGKEKQKEIQKEKDNVDPTPKKRKLDETTNAKDLAEEVAN
ncbi:hypothetical protein L1987_49002 [Smallanthus sonchifolius]|uniref:Uncharacterized protein n=1 Tax=Smallanthus sonchifolius TaxID=185202 RepID=A0ACB9FUL2_9ASTR|nr:hypothetical protein L1987_49002 [Smallanthus sonchifolius]